MSITDNRFYLASTASDVIDRDDPIERYIPQLTIPPESYGWANHLDGLESDNHKTRVTLRDLASHLGGKYYGCVLSFYFYPNFIDLHNPQE